MLRSEFWPEQTVHRAYWEQHNCAPVYEYDPTDDGPECEAITHILAAHPQQDPVVVVAIERAYSDMITILVGHKMAGVPLWN
jgi:hypothetical protein